MTRISSFFRSSPRRGQQLTEGITKGAMERREAYRMIRKRAAAVGVNVKGICSHSFRATGITLYRENGGHLDEEQIRACQSDHRTTKLDDRSGQSIRLDETEKIRF